MMVAESRALDLRDLRDTAKLEEQKPLVGREHMFQLSYIDPGDKKHDDQIVSKVPDGDERIEIARIAARRAGVQWDHLPLAQAARIWAQSTIAVQLRETPDWLNRWATEDDQLLFACFDVCQTHEREFFRFGDGTSEENAEKSRVSIHSTLAAIAT
jgi:hypothetical protein